MSAAVRTLSLSGGPLTLGDAGRLERSARELREDRSARVVVLRSDGDDFCPGAGADLDPLASGLDVPEALAGIRCPTVAVLHGRVFSVGLEMALACDLRIAADDATLAFPEIAAGRLPCWGGTQRAVRAGGLPLALSLLYGEQASAADAARAGLVQMLCAREDLDATAGAVVDRLGTLAPVALELVKEAIHRGSELPLRAGLELEGDLNHLLQSTSDRAEGLAAFLEKRPPDFTGR